jgi:predicted RNA binding protein YcfA (HicA-like mRNA interferase family)
MDRRERQIRELLKQSGAVLLRSKGSHEVWRLPNGRNHVLSKNLAECTRNFHNNLAQLRRNLGGDYAANKTR